MVDRRRILERASSLARPFWAFWRRNRKPVLDLGVPAFLLRFALAHLVVSATTLPCCRCGMCPFVVGKSGPLIIVAVLLASFWLVAR
jgi:hypothetical protein